ncbi:terminase, partial [Candidatus Woesearchaeota archaeon]
SQNATQSDLQQIKQAGWRVKRIKKNPVIKDRVTAMNGMFCNAKNERRYKVNTNLCPFYTDALEQQAYDSNGFPEKGDGKGDDINDAGGYYIVSQYPIKKRVLEQTRLSGL